MAGATPRRPRAQLYGLTPSASQSPGRAAAAPGGGTSAPSARIAQSLARPAVSSRRGPIMASRGGEGCSGAVSLAQPLQNGAPSGGDDGWARRLSRKGARGAGGGVATRDGDATRLERRRRAFEVEHGRARVAQDGR